MTDRHLQKALKDIKFKRQLKNFFMLGIVLLILVLAGWRYVDHQQSAENNEPKNINTKDIEEKRVFNPKYISQDSENRPYTITAENAKEDHNGILQLFKIMVDFQLNPKTKILLTADNASLEHQSFKKAHLDHNVMVTYDDDMTLKTETAMIDFVNGIIEGPKFVQGEGIKGTFKGDLFTVTNKWKIITLFGNAEVILK